VRTSASSSTTETVSDPQGGSPRLEGITAESCARRYLPHLPNLGDTAGLGSTAKVKARALIAGKYELRRPIGVGSMGAVYEGVHLELGKRVAVKVLRSEFCSSTEAVSRFRREARAASAIESEHVAQIFDFGRDDALGLYMVIEYLDGEDLEVRLVRDRRIEVSEAATIGWQLARGLARAHAVGVIHRDLKPANIFLTRRDDGSVLAKVLDFGVSKLDGGKWNGSGAGGTAGAPEPTLTERGTTLGTPQYMSPEQCEGKIALDVRTDVWSLCAVLYEALAGEPAVSDAGGYVAAMHRIVFEQVCPLAKRASWVPEGLARVVDAGLVRNRDRRIPSAAVLAERLLAAHPQSERARSPKPDPKIVVPSDPPPPSSTEDAVEIFVRSGQVPVALGKRRRSPPSSGGAT
jgi:serine/threonine protein kinase